MDFAFSFVELLKIRFNIVTHFWNETTLRLHGCNPEYVVNFGFGSVQVNVRIVTAVHESFLET